MRLPTPPLRTTLLASAILPGLLLGGCATPPATTPAAPPAPVTLRVIAFNDFHGHLEPANLALTLPNPAAATAASAPPTLRVPTGGAAALGGLVAALRQGALHSTVVSSGDLVGAAPLVSSLFRHESTITVMNQLGVDVATAGNHEFDAGTAELQRLLGGGCATNVPGSATVSCALAPDWRGARFPVALANVQRTADGQPLFAPSWVQTVGTVKVGFIGAVTRSTPGIVVPSGVAGLRFEDEAVAINRAAAALQAQGVRALVAVVHEGGEIGEPGQSADWNDTRCPGLRGDIVDIARRITPAVDLILTAHTHQGYNCLLDGRPVMQAVSYGRGVSVADLVIDPVSGQVQRERTVARNLPVLTERTEPAAREALAAALPAPLGRALRSAVPDAALARTVAAYSAAAAPRANQPVGQIGAPFDRSGRTDSAAGRLVADAQLAATRAPERGGAQIALMNPGGVRADLPCRGTPPCTITYGDAFTMQPFGNSLVVMTLTGAELKRLLEQQQPAGRGSPSFMSGSAGFSYRWLASAPAGQRVQDLQLDGQPITPGQPLRITVNSFMADGGDGYSVLKTGRDRLGGAQDLDALTTLLGAGMAQPSAPRVVWVD